MSENDSELLALLKRSYNGILARAEGLEAILHSDSMPDSDKEAILPEYQAVFDTVCFCYSEITMAGYMPTSDEILNGFSD